MKQITTNPFSVSVGTVQEVGGYFSTLGVECAVVIEEHKGHGLVYEFLNHPAAVFSFSLPLKHSLLVHLPLTPCSPASQEPVRLPWRTWQYLTHLERGGVWRLPKSFGLEMSYFLSKVSRPLCLTGTVMKQIVYLNVPWWSMCLFISRFKFFSQYIFPVQFYLIMTQECWLFFTYFMQTTVFFSSLSLEGYFYVTVTNSGLVT